MCVHIHSKCKIIYELYNGISSLGDHSIIIDGTDLPTGIYFVRMHAYALNQEMGSIYTNNQKIMLVK